MDGRSEERLNELWSKLLDLRDRSMVDALIAVAEGKPAEHFIETWGKAEWVIATEEMMRDGR